MAELELPARQLVAGQPRPAGMAGRAGACCCTRPTGTRSPAGVRRCSPRTGFDDITPDGDWLIAMALLADVSAGLGDVRARRRCCTTSSSHTPTLNVVIGLAAVCLGSAETFLGKLAATMGRDREAAAHFERALAANRPLRAPVCVARTQLDYARALGQGRRAHASCRAEAIEHGRAAGAARYRPEGPRHGR